MSAGGAWTIRTGVEADVPSLLALWRAAGGAASGTDSGEAIRRLLEQDPESLLVAEAGGDAIGSLIAGWAAGAAASTGSPSIYAVDAVASPGRWSGLAKTGCGASVRSG
jgi:ribosomal protein S18 acetylase RimI-like enzyme